MKCLSVDENLSVSQGVPAERLSAAGCLPYYSLYVGSINDVRVPIDIRLSDTQIVRKEPMGDDTYRILETQTLLGYLLCLTIPLVASDGCRRALQVQGSASLMDGVVDPETNALIAEVWYLPLGATIVWQGYFISCDFDERLAIYQRDEGFIL